MTPVYRRNDVLVSLDRNPLEIFLLGLCFTSGLAGLLGESPPDGPHVPQVINWVWFGLLVWGGLGGLIGSSLRDAITGVLLVRASMLPAGFGAYVFGVIELLQARFLSGSIVVLFGAAAHLRVVQITKHLRSERQHT